MGGPSTPGQRLGPTLHAQTVQEELGRFRRFGLQQDQKAAVSSANSVFARLGSDNPGRFAAFIKSLDPNRTIGSQLGLADPGAFVSPDAEKPPSLEDSKLNEEAQVPGIESEPVLAARTRSIRQAKASKGRESTILTSPQGLEDTNVSTAIPTLLGQRRNKRKTLLGQ